MTVYSTYNFVGQSAFITDHIYRYAQCVGHENAIASPFADRKMAIYNLKMDISVTQFKHRCLEIIRGVEQTGRAVTITRRGRKVASLQPPEQAAGRAAAKPWEALRALGGRLLAAPGESVLRDKDFDALR